MINSLEGPGVRVLNAEVGWVDPDNRIVYTKIGAVQYDYLFIGTGMVFADWEIPGLAKAPNYSIYYGKTALAYYDATERLKKGTIVIGIPQAPYKCGPAPFETASMTYERLKKKGADFKIIILDANQRPAPGPDTRRKIFLDFINKTNGVIEYHSSEYVKSVDPVNKTLESTKGEVYKWDILMIIGPTHAPDWLIATGLAKRFVDVDRRTFRHVKYDDIFAAGDAQGFTNYGYAVGSGQVAAESLARALGYEVKDPTRVISNENYNNLYEGSYVHIKLRVPVGGQEEGVAELVQGNTYKSVRLGWIKGTVSIYPTRF
ncbi:FAD-dependent oxidoreductase [Pyrobaculum ferrireducens]|uniref:FAD-dependent oxidoreductase n=1 Tax=Pyrobaculum ferrireducens TaxID=1104324 RepID=UPI000AF580AB